MPFWQFAKRSVEKQFEKKMGAWQEPLANIVSLVQCSPTIKLLITCLIMSKFVIAFKLPWLQALPLHLEL